MRKTAFVLYLAFVVSWFLHFGQRFPLLGVIRADLVLVAVIAVLILLSSRETPRVGSSGAQNALIALVAYAILTVPFVEWPGSVLRAGLPNFVKAAIFYVFTRSLVTSESRLRWLLVVFVGAQTFRVLEPVYLHVTQGYWGSYANMAGWGRMDRLAGAPSDIINPNGLAFVVLTVLPFWHYLSWRRIVTLVLYVVTLPILIYALALTGSRSGMVGLAVVLLAVWFKSRRKIVLAAALGVAILFALPALSDELRDRYLSLVKTDTRNAVTAQGRIQGTLEDLRLAMRRPLFGHGLGTSREANANFGTTDVPAHNLVAEVLQEVGIVGLILFTVYVALVFRGLRRTIRALRDEQASPLLLGVSDSVQVALVMTAVFSLASYGLSSYEWYLLPGLAEATGQLAKPAEAEIEPQPEPLPGDAGAPVL